jgi:TetR/AcrR family transcriptional regulator, transcriptional repressor for nem operon
MLLQIVGVLKKEMTVAHNEKNSSNTLDLSTKKRLLDVAMHTFMVKGGFHATTIEMVAHNCHIKKPSVFHHYESKIKLVLHIVDTLNNYCQNDIFKQHHHHPKENARLFLKTSCDFLIDKKEGQFIALLGNELISIDDALKKAIHTYFDNWRNAIRTVITPFYPQHQIENIIHDSLIHIQGCLSIYHLTNDDPIHLTQLRKRLTALWLP